MAPTDDDGAPAKKAPSTQLVTGGTGGLGLLTAGWLVEIDSASHLVLVSRSGTVASDAMARLHATGNGATVRRCDISQRIDALSTAVTIQRALPPLRGVWHTAGVLGVARWLWLEISAVPRFRDNNHSQRAARKVDS